MSERVMAELLMYKFILYCRNNSQISNKMRTANMADDRIPRTDEKNIEKASVFSLIRPTCCNNNEHEYFYFFRQSEIKNLMHEARSYLEDDQM